MDFFIRLGEVIAVGVVMIGATCLHTSRRLCACELCSEDRERDVRRDALRPTPIASRDYGNGRLTRPASEPFTSTSPGGESGELDRVASQPPGLVRPDPARRTSSERVGSRAAGTGPLGVRPYKPGIAK